MHVGNQLGPKGGATEIKTGTQNRTKENRRTQLRDTALEALQKNATFN